MAEKYIMIHDIMSEHKDRMYNLRKYYPFFALCETTFSQYKEGRFADLDMGYIIMASLRFFINENNFHESEVSYEEYAAFLAELLRREFSLQAEEDEERELIGYIFDKLKNDGKAFAFSYFDPEEKRKKTARVKLIDSRIADGKVLYHVTADGIEFYLETKEVKDESSISVQQLLLEKMIRSENFAGGIEVVRRINSEVGRLALQKKEVLDLLSYDVFAGARAGGQFMETVAKWFEEESKLFEKNRALIDRAFQRANGESGSALLKDIHQLDTELKKTIIRHGELIKETMDLQNVADEMIRRAKLRKLKTVFQFREALKRVMDADAPQKMDVLVAPLFRPRLARSFAVESIDRMLEGKAAEQDYTEKREKKVRDADYVFADEVEDARIAQNYGRLFGELLEQLWKHGRTTLSELMAVYEIKFGKEIYKNGDVYSFLVHLAQKDTYDLAKLRQKQDTFLEGLVTDALSVERQNRFENMVFHITFYPERRIRFGDGKDEAFAITDMEFER